MTVKVKLILVAILLLKITISTNNANAQKIDSTTWSLQRCIEYALEQNIQVKKSNLNNSVNQLNYEQQKAQRYPTLQASVSKNFSWEREFENNSYGDFSGSNSTNYGLNSSVRLFDGFRVKNNIKQSELQLEAGKYDTESTKESLSLSVLDAYLQVLYASEQVKNSEKQVESTTEQLRLAQERLNLKAISKADYLQVKAALSSEKLTLANAESMLAIRRLNLMQLMELPSNTDFNLYYPNFDDDINQNRSPKADSVFSIALAIKPQIKSASLLKESAITGVDIAKSGYFPSLSMNADISTGYYSSLSDTYINQLDNKLRPAIGLSLSIPILQNKKVKINISKAKINVLNADLDEINIKNQLRKSIEQACVDVISAEKEFESGIEQFNSAQESYEVSREKYNLGLISSLDFLIQKTNLITAESNYLQSKFNLIFSYKVLDFYSGKSITL